MAVYYLSSAKCFPLCSLLAARCLLLAEGLAIASAFIALGESRGECRASAYLAHLLQSAVPSALYQQRGNWEPHISISIFHAVHSRRRRTIHFASTSFLSSRQSYLHPPSEILLFWNLICVRSQELERNLLRVVEMDCGFGFI